MCDRVRPSGRRARAIEAAGRLSPSKALGLALGLAGVVLLASPRETPGDIHALRVAKAAVAPLAWAVYDFAA